MKRIVLSFLMLLCMTTIYAQKVKHPSLLYTPERIQSVKNRIAREPEVAECWKQIKETADKKLQNGGLNDVEYLSLTYLMTGEKKYSDRIKKILLDVIQAKTWGSAEMLARIPVWTADLGLSHKAHLSAIAYDAIYNDLSTSERKEIALGLKRLALDPSLGDWLLEPTRIHALNSMGHNWWTSCVCMGGLLALSLQNEIPEAKEGARFLNEALPEWFSFAGDVLQQKPKSFDDARWHV